MKVADLEEWKAQSDRVPGTDPALPDDGRVTHVPTAWPADAETRGLTGRDLWEARRLYQNEGAVLPLAAEWDKQSPEAIDCWNRLAVFATSRVVNAIAAEPDAADHGDARADAAFALLDQAYGRSKNQRKLIERQRDEIAVLVRERDNARAERDAGRAERDLEAMPIPAGDAPADASKECLRASLVNASNTITRLCGERNEAVAARDAAMDRTSLIEKERNAAWKERDEAKNDARRHKRAVDDRDSEIAALKDLRQRRENELAEVKVERDKAHARIAELDEKVRKQQGDMIRIGEIADQPPF